MAERSAAYDAMVRSMVQRAWIRANEEYASGKWMGASSGHGVGHSGGALGHAPAAHSSLVRDSYASPGPATMGGRAYDALVPLQPTPATIRGDTGGPAQQQRALDDHRSGRSHPQQPVHASEHRSRHSGVQDHQSHSQSYHKAAGSQRSGSRGGRDRDPSAKRRSEDYQGGGGQHPVGAGDGQPKATVHQPKLG